MMSNLFRITPLEKKNVEFFIDVYERMPDGSIRGFDVTEVYRWGQGFRETYNYISEHEAKGLHGIYCDPNIGWGCELDDLCGVYLNFTDGYTDEEKQHIEAMCRGDEQDDEGRWGAAWIFDGDHALEIEDNTVYILGPVKIDLVDEDEYNKVIQENMTPADTEAYAKSEENESN